MSDEKSLMENLLKDFPVVIPIPLAWGEMDAFAHLNNIIYFRYFESARIAFFEKMGVTSQGAHATIGPILASTSCRFKAPLTFPDTAHTGTRIINVTKDRFTMEYIIVSEKRKIIAALGEALIVSYDYKAGRKVPLPAAWRERFPAAVTRASDAD